jgi:hypothetical protein
MNPIRRGLGSGRPRARRWFFSMAIALCMVTVGVGGLADRAGAAVQSSVRVAPATQASATAPAGFFRPLPGTATDISEGADGSLWVIGTNPVPGGFGIFKWTGRGWAGLPGGAVKIAVAPDGTPVVVNSAHQIFLWTGRGWLQGPGTLTDIAVGADGSLWGIGTNPVPGGFGIFLFTGDGWTGVPGGAVTIAVGPNGAPAVTNSSDHIYIH